MSARKVAQLQRQLDQAAAIAEDCPAPDELQQRAAQSRIEFQAGRQQYLRVVEVRYAGIQGDLLKFSIDLLVDGAIGRRDVQAALAGYFSDTRPIPGGEGEIIPPCQNR